MANALCCAVLLLSGAQVEAKAGKAAQGKGNKTTIDILAEFDPGQPTPLCKLMHDFGSDKGAPVVRLSHNYTPYYLH